MSQDYLPEDGRIPPCIDCGGPNVLGCHLENAPYGRLFWRLRAGRQANRMLTFVCLGCGRVKLYVDDIASMRRYAEANPSAFRW